jgi:hypothetical protein
VIESYEDIATCVTYMGNAEGTLFGFDSYMQIAACGTYRRRSQPLTPFSDESPVALHMHPAAGLVCRFNFPTFHQGQGMLPSTRATALTPWKMGSLFPSNCRPFVGCPCRQCYPERTPLRISDHQFKPR